MVKLTSEQAEREATRVAATIMASSARTAPKGRGVDSVQTAIIEGDDIEALAQAMEDKAEEKPVYLSPVFARDARNLRTSTCVLLVGVTGEPKKIDQPLDCGACGYDTCRRLLKARRRDGSDFSGPLCVFQAIDLGIALGSAAKLASELNIDNRLMYTVGAAAKRLGFLGADVVIGIPLSTGGKNPYFDRQ